jgi:glyoxylase-like metal-dependent hydrolase (beta-lactamase superfamily II)
MLRRACGVRRKIGDIDMTALSDGPFPATLDTLIDFDRDEAQRLIGKPPGTPFFLPVNSYLLTLGGKRVLIDTGCGQTMGPKLGQLPNRLREIGVAPDAIDVILLTHIHPDHAMGLVDAEGAAIFPRAELIVHEVEANFWLGGDPASAATERIRRNIGKAKHATAPYRERLRTVRDGEAMSGVSAMLLPGHTPGHTGWVVHAGRDSVLIWGDVVHIPAIQVARPEAAFEYDVDPQAARATRQRTFDMVSADRLSVAGAHLDFPGLGTIVRTGTRYRFEPDN